ncbi:MAG: transporter [Aquabacterium sp.]
MVRVSNRSKPVLSIEVTALALALSAATQVMAAENGLQRYSPGIGGSDMTTPLVPGWYVQLPMVAYHASKLKGDDGKTATAATPAPLTGPYAPYSMPGLRSEVDAKATNYALLPRLTYLSATRWLGANVGLTAMLPLVKRKATFDANPLYPSGIPAGLQSQVTANVRGRVAGQNGTDYGLSDLEVSPVLHWEIGDHQAVTLAPTIVLPTGDYKATQRVNAGFGNFVTFRPSIQYAFIGDGWDVGGRAVLSFNTRNKDNGYYSGNMFNFDYQLMKFVSEDVRVGLQGYFVRQLNKDTQDLDGFSAQHIASLGGPKEIINGNKSSVNAAGPAVGWLKNGGEFLLEGKFLKEFDARNRFEGQAFWLTLSKPL